MVQAEPQQQRQSQPGLVRLAAGQRRGQELETHPAEQLACIFGGSAWQWDEETEEYYLHLFAKQQPDLNWENPKVVSAVHDVIRFWLDRGVDGFRMDVINFISKVPELPDAPVTVPDSEFQDGSRYYACGPRLHEFFQGIGSIMGDNAFSVGEMPGCTMRLRF